VGERIFSPGKAEESFKSRIGLTAILDLKGDDNAVQAEKVAADRFD